jgi:D-alanyl-D-alanine carboxypeptidase
LSGDSKHNRITFRQNRQVAALKKARFLKTLALSLAFQAVALPNTAASAQTLPAEHPRPDRYAAIVIDAETGTTLFERDGDQQLRPASTTKVMTAYLVFQALRDGRLTLDQELEVSGYAAGMPRTNLAMIGPVTYTDKKTGKRRTVQRQKIKTITVENALKGMLVHSANDAAVVLAEAIAGDTGRFAEMMNETAKNIGATGTNFVNPNGLPDDHQYTTVEDMAKISAAAIRDFPEYYSFFNTRTFTYNGVTYRNYNNMLGSYPGADGLKTGWISSSGYNLTASAERDGHRVIGVVFGARTPVERKKDMTELFDYGLEVMAKSPPAVLLPENPLDSIDNSNDPEEAPGFISRNGQGSLWIDRDFKFPQSEDNRSGFNLKAAPREQEPPATPQQDVVLRTPIWRQDDRHKPKHA